MAERETDLCESLFNEAKLIKSLLEIQGDTDPIFFDGEQIAKDLIALMAKMDADLARFTASMAEMDAELNLQNL